MRPLGGGLKGKEFNLINQEGKNQIVIGTHPKVPFQASISIVSLIILILNNSINYFLQAHIRMSNFKLAKEKQCTITFDQSRNMVVLTDGSKGVATYVNGVVCPCGQTAYVLFSHSFCKKHTHFVFNLYCRCS